MNVGLLTLVCALCFLWPFAESACFVGLIWCVDVNVILLCCIVSESCQKNEEELRSVGDVTRTLGYDLWLDIQEMTGSEPAAAATAGTSNLSPVMDYRSVPLFCRLKERSQKRIFEVGDEVSRWRFGLSVETVRMNNTAGSKTL